MICRDISLLSPSENIIFDEVLLKLADLDQSPETIRFWESPNPFVVLGRICKVEDDLRIDHLLEDSIPVLRRGSGGGTVLQGRGCLNFSLILSKQKDKQLDDIKLSYQYILSRIVQALSKAGIDAKYLPISDIALNSTQKKISGNAQKRGKSFILHHGTLLYNFDLSLIEKYLKIPKSMPDYRENRNHSDFVTNISIDVDVFKKEMCEVFEAEQSNNKVSDAEKQLIEELIEEQTPIVKI